MTIKELLKFDILTAPDPNEKPNDFPPKNIYVIEVNKEYLPLDQVINYVTSCNPVFTEMKELLEWQTRFFQLPQGHDKDQLLKKCKNREYALKQKLETIENFTKRFEEKYGKL